ncbi:MAG TPA: hypothetical protein VJU61_06155 [Polyangiaceae bacterium]|nr:hypothetical protein [Polyangiaceae bacterium]
MARSTDIGPAAPALHARVPAMDRGTKRLTYPSPSDPYCGRLLLIKVDAVSGSVLSRDTFGYCS